MLACSSLMLTLAGGTAAGVVMLFACALVVAWKLEGSRWQLSNRVSVGTMLLAMLLFYLQWKYGFGVNDEEAADSTTALTYLLLSLIVIKLLQAKVDRDWVLLYLISFLQILLAARSQLDALFALLSVLYLFLAACSFVSFEFKRSMRRTQAANTNAFNSVPANIDGRKVALFKRVPLIALCLLLLTLTFALPLFYVAPRFNVNAFAQAARGRATNVAGFTDHMALGQAGRIQQTDEVVMRVQLGETNRLSNASLRWRGAAFDEFDGRNWRRSKEEFETASTLGRGFFAFSTTRNPQALMTQIFFLEPSDTSVLFAAVRPVALQGALPYVLVDSEGALQTREHLNERVSYRIYSDTEQPTAEELRSDQMPYMAEAARYLQLPRALDPRVSALASEIAKRQNAQNRYDAARAIESYLQSNYKYSLDMRAGGRDPLADFLFRVREGHCEYYAAAMAAMLRTQGIAARVVNGFQAGEYNDVADAYIVRQRNAHSWVEVYFPGTKSWSVFDPTPFDETTGERVNSSGVSNRLVKYMDAAELFWIQNVVSYDRQAQRALANKVRTQLENYTQAVEQKAEAVKSVLADFWWQPSVANERRAGASLNFVVALIVLCFAIILMLLILRKRGVTLRRVKKQGTTADVNSSGVAFYRRMTDALARRGLRRPAGQTPLEFAESINNSEALIVTRFYHRVRYGAQDLSRAEQAEIENCLRKLETI
ncbi:MAG: DUF3488 and transglutaminase-like domain-containing protein [Pyrinomonadaceae bacterium]